MAFFRKSVLLGFFLFPLLVHGQSLFQKKVLVLHSYEPTWEWTAEENAGLAEELAKAFPTSLSVNTEYLDAGHIADKSQYLHFRDFLHQKYRGVQFDVIIATDSEALEFLLDYRENLFQAVPVVFCGVDDFNPLLLNGKSDIVGVTEHTDVASTLDILPGLHPGVKRVVAVMDNDHPVLEQNLEYLSEFGNYPFNISVLKRVYLNEVIVELQKLPEKTVVLWLGSFLDSTGLLAPHSRALELATSTVGLPFYSAWDFNLGHGIVGGMLTNGRHQGNEAARLAIRILHGESPADLPVISPSPNYFMFDFRQLRHHQVSLGDLPDNSELINEPGFFERYLAVFWMFLFVFVSVSIWMTYILLHNIQRRKKAEADLVESIKKYRVLFHSFPLGVLITDREGKVVDINPALSLLLELKPEQILDHNLQGIDLQFQNENGESLKDTDCPALRALRELTTVEEPALLLVRNDKALKWLSVVAVPVGLPEYGVAVAFLDVSERKHISEKLHAAKVEAEKANSAKSQFLANMSHEIRTPMNAILGFTEILQNINRDPVVQNYLASIYSSGRSLLELINDILDLSKVEAGKMELSPGPTNIHILLADMKNIFQHKALGKGLRFEVLVAADVPAILVMDEVRMRQILFNLVGNALKFTESGFVRVELSASQPQNGKIDVKIEVIDSGIGINPAEQADIFKPFYQQHGQSAKYGGTGLGLPICKKLAQLMNGQLSVSSRPREGSVFTLLLKNVEIAGSEAGLPEQPAAEVMNVEFEKATLLLVEDMATNREVVRAFLEGTGLDIIEAENGRLALNILEQQQPDLILLDMRMPVMNGYEFLQEYHSKKNKKPVPVVACTASVMKNEQDQISSLCDGFLEKPFTRNQLLQTCANFLAHRKITAGESTSTPLQQELDAGKVQERIFALLNLIEQEIVFEWEKALGKNIINYFIDFAQKLQQINEDYAIALLEDYSSRLLNLSRKFNQKQARSEMEKFPSLVAELKKMAEELGVGTDKSS